MGVKEESVTKARQSTTSARVQTRGQLRRRNSVRHAVYVFRYYEGDGLNPPVCEMEPTNRKKVVILGGGPDHYRPRD